MDQIEFHPLANAYPMMTGWEYEQLKRDLRENGQRVSILLYDGKILDGRNRYQALTELGIEPKFRESGCENDDAARDAVQSLNDRRRHESMEVIRARAEDRREKVKTLRKQGKSTRQIADEVGVSHPTVIADLKQGGNHLPPATGEAQDDPDEQDAEPEEVTGRDGKKYPATKAVKPFSIGEAIQKLQSDMEKHRMKWPWAQRHEYVKAVTHYMKLAGSITEEKWS
jgi:hypothetical protein